MYVTLKPGATCSRIAPAGFRLLRAIDLAADRLKLPLTITSGDEGTWRAATDPHKLGAAYDLSVQGLAPREILTLLQALRTTLPSTEFTILFEAPPGAIQDVELLRVVYSNPRATGAHIHLQRKKGTVWPLLPRATGTPGAVAV